MQNSYVSPSELKDEAPAPTTARELTLVLALLALLVAAANLFAGIVLDRWSPNLGYAVVETKWNILQGLDRPVDWLVLGDSSGNQGVDPRVLRNRLGGTAVNLATTADMLAVNDAWMLNEYVRRYGSPRAVVLVHVYDMWERQLQAASMAEVPLPWGYWTSMRPAVSVGPRRALTLATLRYAPLYARQESLLLLLRGRADFGRRSSFSTDGFMEVQHADPRRVEADAHGHLQATRARRFLMSEDNRRALVEIRGLAERHDFNVFLADAPLYEQLYQSPEFRSYHNQVAGALIEWANSSPRLHYLFRPPILFPSDTLETVDHLTSQGAQRYSGRLAEEMASRLGAVRPGQLESRVNDSGALVPTR